MNLRVKLARLIGTSSAVPRMPSGPGRVMHSGPAGQHPLAGNGTSSSVFTRPSVPGVIEWSGSVGKDSAVDDIADLRERDLLGIASGENAFHRLQRLLPRDRDSLAHSGWCATAVAKAATTVRMPIIKTTMAIITSISVKPRLAGAVRSATRHCCTHVFPPPWL